MRNRNKEMYGKGIFISYRHSVQHYLETAGKRFDIFKGKEFKLSMKAFNCMTMEIRRQGRGKIVHYLSFNDQDLETIFSYLTLDQEDSQRLRYKIYSICI